MSRTIVNWAKQAAFDLVSTSEQVRDRVERPVEFGGWKFSAPRPFFDAVVPAKAGLFVVQVPRWQWSGRVFEPIDMGECENLYDSLLRGSDDRFLCWLADPRAARGLFVSVRPTPSLDKARRRQMLVHLVGEYMADLDDYLRCFETRRPVRPHRGSGVH